MKVFRFALQDDQDNALYYSHLGIETTEDFEFVKRFFELERSAEEWRPISLKCITGKYNDMLSEFSLLNITSIPVLSLRIANMLKSQMKDDLELLSTLSGDGDFKIIRIVPKTVALDFENSYIYRNPDYGFIINVFVYGFYKEVIQNKLLFRVPEFPMTYFATETCKKLLEDAGLKGIKFWLVWDSDNPDYVNESWTPGQWEKFKREFQAGARTYP